MKEQHSIHRVKAALFLGVALAVAIAGVAKATGVFEGQGHQDASYDVVEAKVSRLEGRFEAREAPGPGSVAARPQRGPRGKRGPRGPQGQAGPKGTFGSVVTVNGPSTYLCSFGVGGCAVGSTEVSCPPGTTLVGGGYTGAGIVTIVTWNAPVANSWGIIAVNLDEVPVSNLKAVATCAS